MSHLIYRRSDMKNIRKMTTAQQTSEKIMRENENSPAYILFSVTKNNSQSDWLINLTNEIISILTVFTF